MSLFYQPPLPLPEPLRAAEVPSFTNFSVVVRLPDIARRTLAENPFPFETVASIEALIDEIPEGKVRPVQIPATAPIGDWPQWIAVYEGWNWLDIPWFFAEEYFYLRILEATGYFETGESHARDPYVHQKRLGLESTRTQTQALAELVSDAIQHAPESNRESLDRLLLADLWGNQNDLSMWPVQKGAPGQALPGEHPVDPASSEQATKKTVEKTSRLESAQEKILANDLKQALDWLLAQAATHPRVDLLLDNAGFELVTDLALADFLLTTQLAGSVTLHVKSYPVFVSDALEKDVFDTLDFLIFTGHAASKEMAVRLRRCLVNDRLRIRHHPFWTSPLPAWEMPQDLQEQMADTCF